METFLFWDNWSGRKGVDYGVGSWRGVLRSGGEWDCVACSDLMVWRDRRYCGVAQLTHCFINVIPTLKVLRCLNCHTSRHPVVASHF